MSYRVGVTWNVLRGKKEQTNYFDGLPICHSIREVKQAVKFSK